MSQPDQGALGRVVELLAGVGAGAGPDTLRHIYSVALDGFATSLTPVQASRLAVSDGVTSIEPDRREFRPPNWRPAASTA
jgi:hypothetical protein